MVSGPLGLRTAHGLRTTRSPDRSWSPDYMVSGSCRLWQSRSLPFPDHRPRSAGWAWARMPRHARTACICKDTIVFALSCLVVSRGVNAPPAPGAPVPWKQCYFQQSRQKQLRPLRTCIVLLGGLVWVQARSSATCLNEHVCPKAMSVSCQIVDIVVFGINKKCDKGYCLLLHRQHCTNRAIFLIRVGLTDPCGIAACHYTSLSFLVI